MFIKTVSTTSGINPIKFDETSGVFYWILNTGSSTIYASTKSAFTAGDDGVVSLGPKESRRLETNNDTIYILGEGQVEIHNQRDGICSFKQAPTSSGGGGTIDAYSKTESDAKYAAKSDVPDAYTKTESDAKYAAKSDVPDAYTKTESDTKYAQKTDIPTSLPANGGDADTVDGKHASDFMPINGEVRKYGLIRMNSTDGIRARHIDGNDTEFDGALYLNWNNPNAPIYMNGDNMAIHSGNIGSQSVNYANSAGNANTVGGFSNGYYLGTLSANGDGHGAVHRLQCQHNKFGDNRFGLKIESGYEVRCDYATNADTLDGLHASDIITSSKPYVTGTVVPVYSEGIYILTTNHGFMPSAVMWWGGIFNNSSGNSVQYADSFNNTKFEVHASYGSPITDKPVNYIIFK